MSNVFLVQGLGFGDEGKGSVVDYLVRREKARLVVRFNGGAQAGHNVVTDDGRHHCFSQFGSGTFEFARTFLSRFMLFNPCTILKEAEHLQSLRVFDPLSLVTVENQAVVTTPFHMAANRIREMARTSRHGSCGMGIGETMDHSLKFPASAYYVRDMLDRQVSDTKLLYIRSYLLESVQALVKPGDPDMEREWDILTDFKTTLEFINERHAEVLRRIQIVDSAWLPNKLHNEKGETVIFEGAQGVLLDQDYGFAPYTTWTDCTFGNAMKLISSTLDTRCGFATNGQGHVTNCRCNKHDNDVTRVGVLRGYMTRHGAGPLVTECQTCKPPPGEHNSAGPWQERFRMGHFDSVATRYALQAIGGVDQLALTCLDHLQTDIKSCSAYEGKLGSCDDLLVTRPSDAKPFDEMHQLRQKMLGEMLFASKPVYEPLSNVEDFIANVEEVTETPVKITSYGPKASDKRTR